MKLNSSTDILKIVLAGAKNTNDAHVVLSYVDVGMDGKLVSRERSASVVTNGVTPVNVLAGSAGAEVTRRITDLALHNADVAAIIATLSYYDGTNTRTVVKATLQAGESLRWNEQRGWHTLGTDGGLRHTTAAADYSLVKYAEATIIAADITDVGAGKLGHANGYEVVAAPGADKAIEVLSAVVIYDRATANYGGGGNVSVNYSGGGGALTGVVSAANSIGAAGDKVALLGVAVPANNQLLVNTGLSLVAAAAFTQPGTAAGVVRVKVAYRVHTLGL